MWSQEKRPNPSFHWLVLMAAWLTVAGPVAAQNWVYMVSEGDTLWDLSEKYLHRVTYWKELQRINRVENPKKMQPGKRLRIPFKWIKSHPASAQVLSVVGTASLIRATDQTPVPLAGGEVVHLGDRLRTGAGTSVAVKLADASEITLHENSVMLFDHLSAYGDTGMVDTRLRLNRGRSDARVKPATGPGSRFEIQTPSAISAVRGTRYRTSVAERDTTASGIEVLEGAVLVKGSARGRLVRAGFGTRVGTGESPSRPRQLLTAPEIDALPAKVRQLNWPVTWQALKDADRYRMEISESAVFETVVSDRLSASPRLPLPDLSDGDFYLRIRGIDSVGLEGLDTVRRFTLDARPQPPLPLLPRQGEVFRGRLPVLSWTRSAEAAHYRLEVATDAEFKHKLFDQTGLTGSRLTLPGEAVPGRYFWRLTSIADDGEHGPAGAVRHWLLKAVPDGPEPVVAADERQVLVSWREGASGQTYQVQIASDDAFEHLLLDKALASTQIEVEPIKGQLRYIRVRIVEPDGYLGPWGATQKLDPAPDSGWLLVVLPWILGILLL